MDGFESIRQTAVQLHDELVQAGQEHFDPLTLVQAAADYLDIELVWLEPGDPALKNAHALFDEQSGMICCEKVSDPATCALLVAHEIGHVKLHAVSSTCAADDIDPSRSTETVPVGLQRVEDYGAHERRELQANIFAREFLLPRPLGKRLYLEDGFTAAAISARTGLPKPLVRQQLFDALLLPDVPKREADPVALRTSRSDLSQDRAAAHRGTPLLLQAGPGTGKTRTLVKRTRSLLAEGIDPSAILILTFSNRAAGELLERLTRAVPDAAPRLWIGTFHAFGLDLIRRHHDRFGLSPNPTLFDRSDAIEVLEEIFPTLPLIHYRNLWDPTMILRDVIMAISRAKDELTDPVHYRTLAEAMRADAGVDGAALVAAEKCLEIADIYDLYERAMQERDAVDFGDLIMRPTRLLKDDPALCKAIQLRHRHLLVDEYQDVNRASAHLLKAVAGDGHRLWVVGDTLQSIYRFRGASSVNMTKFDQDYPGAEIARLDVNYRSTKQIVDTIVSVAPRMGASTGMPKLVLEADRGVGPIRPDIRRYETIDEEAEGIAASILDLEREGVALRDQAVLCRSNRRLNQIAIALEALGIPILHFGSFFEREEIRDLLALLSLAVDMFGDALVRVGTMPRYNLTLQDVYATLLHLKASDRPVVLEDLSTLSTAAGLSEEGVASISKLAEDLAGIASHTSAWEFLSTYLLDRTDLVREMAQGRAVADQMRAIAVWQFLNFVREQSPVSGGLPIRRTLDRVRRLVLLAEERDLRQVPVVALHMDAVRLMTVHGSKGLEFEAVHVPGLTVSSFPTSNRGQRCPPPAGMIEGVDDLSVTNEAKYAHDYEEECLFFVALSRARTYLRLYLARKQPSGKNRSPSPFLGWIPSELVDEIKHPATLPLLSDTPHPSRIVVTWPTGWHPTDSHLTAYEKCPRRFFYTHVLGLGGARKATPFSQTHDCLYGLLHWLADTRREREPSLAEIEAAFEDIWQRRGPINHGFADDYKRLALRLLNALHRASADQRFLIAETLAINLPEGKIMVKPNEIVELPDGTVVLRRVRTGRKRSQEYDRLEYTLYWLAAQARFGSDATVQALHLADEIAESVTVSPRKLDNRRNKSNTMLSEIATGLFPPKIDSVTCPRCPHFFICAATPQGHLKLI